MRIVSFLLRYSKVKVALAILVAIIGGLSNAGLIVVINTAIRARTGPASPLVLGFVALCLSLTSARVISQSLLTNLTQKAIIDLRMSMSRQILTAPLRHLEEVGAHRLTATLVDDVGALSNGLTGIPNLCLHSAILVGCLAYLAWLDWMVFLGVVLFISIGYVTFHMAAGKAMKYLTLAREQQDSLFKHFRALTQGTKELKLHHRRRNSFLRRSLQSTAEAYKRHNVTGNIVYTAAGSWGELLFFVLLGILLFAFPTLANIGTPTLISYIFTLLFMVTSIDVVSSMLPSIGRANVALKKVESMGLSLTDKSNEDDSICEADRQPTWARLDFIGVTHIYHQERDNSEFILGPIDITLSPGELVFLTGGNGSGKTTLAKLLTGLYIPQSGEIRFNNRLVNDKSRESYRQHFSAVFSDFYLFDNLLGLESPDLDAQARNYLKQLQLEHKVQINAGKLSTTDLSQGQRKRLALLAAYLENRPIYLFDEWAADQDPLFKEVFYMRLLPELKARAKTVVVISHDEKYYHIADRILKLDYGQLVQDTYVTTGQKLDNLPQLPLYSGQPN
jgi:putative pyoverdin transport system ATP-binding/permease protein